MKLINIDRITLDAYLKDSPKPHFLQSPGWADVAKSRGLIPHMLGLYDDDKMVGSALLLERKILYYSTFYCPRGFILDHYDEDLIKAMTILLKDYVKKHHGLSFKIDPDLIIHKLDPNDASVLETNEDHMHLIDIFKSLGYKHRGFTIKFNESSAPRFTFRVKVDEDIDKIHENMHQTTRNILNRDNPYKVKIRKNNFDDFKAFYKTMADTAHRKAILLEPLRFYETFYDNLYKNDMSDLIAAYIDTDEVRAIFDADIKDTNDKILELEANLTKKNKGRLNDLKDHLNKILKEKAQVDMIKEKEVVLSAIMTAKYADKVWIVHGGNRDILKFLSANYYLYDYVLKDSHDKGYKEVDLYGTEGKVDKDSELYGLYLFKSRFGGDLDEFIGEFDMDVRPITASLINKALYIRRKIKLKRAIKKG